MNYLGEKAKNHNEITGKTFVITGTLNNYTRDEIKDLIFYAWKVTERRHG